MFSILKVDYPPNYYEVLVVDNASEDGSVEYLRKSFPSVRVIKLGKNYGFGKAANCGAKQAKGEILVFLNNDTIVDRAWLREIVKPFIENKRVAVCGSRVKSIDNPEVDQYAGGFLNMLGGGLFYPFHGKAPSREHYLVGCIHGASFAIRKRVFDEVGGFDEDYFMYSDEGDLCHRVALCGYFIAYSPKSIVYHYGGGTAGILDKDFQNPFKGRIRSHLRIYYGNRNSLVNLLKNLNIKNMTIGFFLSILYYLFQLLCLLKMRDSLGIKYLLKSLFHVIINLRRIFSKRVTIQIKRKVRDQELIKQKVLLTNTWLLRLSIAKLKHRLNAS